MEAGVETLEAPTNDSQAADAAANGAASVEHESRLDIPMQLLRDSRRGLEPTWESLQSELESILEIQERVEQELEAAGATPDADETAERLQHYDSVLSIENQRLSELHELLEEFSGSLNQVRDEIGAYREEIDHSRRKVIAAREGEVIQPAAIAEAPPPDGETMEIRAALQEMYGISAEDQAARASAAPIIDEEPIEEPIEEEETLAAEPEPITEAPAEPAGDSNGGVELATARFMNQPPQEEPAAEKEETPVAESPTEPESTDAVADEEEDSVAAYMERLLQRNGLPGSSNTNAADVLRANRESQQAGKPAEKKPEAKREEPKKPRKPREKKPQDKAKIREGMSSMRELANMQARQAVAKHQWTQSVQNMSIFGGMAGVGCFAALVLLTAGLWSMPGLIPYAGAALAIGGFAAAQFLRCASACRDRFLGDNVTGARKLLVKLLHCPFSIKCRIATSVSMLVIAIAMFASGWFAPFSLAAYGWSAFALAFVFGFDAGQSLYETREQWLAEMLEKSRQKREAREAEAAEEE